MWFGRARRRTGAQVGEEQVTSGVQGQLRMLPGDGEVLQDHLVAGAGGRTRSAGAASSGRSPASPAPARRVTHSLCCMQAPQRAKARFQALHGVIVWMS